jgi:hypothetical protein
MEETLEEAAKNHINNDLDLYESLTDGHISYDIGMDLLHKLFIAGAKYMAERMYSEGDMIEFGKFCRTLIKDNKDILRKNPDITEKELLQIWFEQFKKK